MFVLWPLVLKGSSDTCRQARPSQHWLLRKYPCFQLRTSKRMLQSGSVVSVPDLKHSASLRNLQSPETHKTEPGVYKDDDQKAASNTSSLVVPYVTLMKPALYGALNIASATGIVFANKAVLSVYGFEFATALTLLHTLTTVLGMMLFCQLGMFTPKQVPALQVAPLAAAYVGYVVLNNLSLKLNTVGFYQISKICIMPTLIAIEIALFGKYPSQKTLMAVALVCIGVALATVTDQGLTTNLMGLLVGVSAILVTAMYQVWAGSKQRELQTGSMQLLHQYTPLAAFMLAVLVPMLEPVGLFDTSPNAHTLIGYTYSLSSITAIAISSVLGLLVSLSTFLVIGATSSLTYNIVGHLKTVTILTGGCLIFGDTMSVSKLSGVALAMLGIAWYSQMQFASLQLSKGVKPKSPDAELGHAQTGKQ